MFLLTKKCIFILIFFQHAASVLTKAERFAQRIGAMFASFAPNAGTTMAAQTGCFLQFFSRILQNPFPPADYFTITNRGILTAADGKAEDLYSNRYKF